MTILAIALGGGVGAALRGWVDSLFAGRTEFPWGAMMINLSGSALIGLVAGLGLAQVSGQWQQILATGFLGGYTTFSTAVVQTADMLLAGKPLRGATHAIGMAVGSCALAASGLWLAQILVG